MEVFRRALPCAVPSSHFTRFDKKAAELLFAKRSYHGRFKDDDHGVSQLLIEAMTEIEKADEMAVIPYGPDKLA